MIFLSNIFRSVYARLFRLTSSHRFRAFGQNIHVWPGVHFYGESNIELGDRITILDGSSIAVDLSAEISQAKKLQIGSGSSIGRRNHIYAASRIEIGEKVLTASNVYISDCTHGYQDHSAAVMDQPVRLLNTVSIGDGAWIGQNVCIIGCSIGRNSVIGANSVVLHDIPDYSVAVGAPARVVRQYDTQKGVWINCGSNE